MRFRSFSNEVNIWGGEETRCLEGREKRGEGSGEAREGEDRFKINPVFQVTDVRPHHTWPALLTSS